MDWTKQSEEMFKAWSDSQTKMWDSFVDSVSGLGKSPSQKMWEQAISNGEEMIKNALEAQTEWLKAWATNLEDLEGMPEQAKGALAQFKETAQRWTDTQGKLWGAWFELLAKFDPTKAGGLWGESTQNPFKVWQDMAKQAMDAQMDWMKTWADQFKTETED